ncbi:TetR family transcriptional regulator [Rhizorhapis sp. SPR117]|nr:TetR family transcriptional regulator [Rhizorhapis sp. SPR117]
MRAITKEAGVSNALVNRYFGTKEKLFEEALTNSLEASSILELPRTGFGEAMVELLLRGPRSGASPLAMIMLASGDPRARAIAQRLLIDVVYHPLARWLGSDLGKLRAARFMIISAGFVIYSQIYTLDMLNPIPHPELRSWLARELQSLVDEGEADEGRETHHSEFDL